MPLSQWSSRKHPLRRLRLESLEDRTTPTLAVVSATPAPVWVPVPMTQVDLHFDNPVNPTSVQSSDLVLLRNGSSFGSVTTAAVVPGTNGQTVRFTLSGLTTAGHLQTYLRPGAILAVNSDPNLSYTADYTLTSIGFSSLAPAGSLIFAGSRSGGTHTFAVEDGQAMTLVVTAPGPGSAPLSVTLRGPAVGANPGPILGTVTAPSLTAAAVLQSIVAPATGLYTATITGGPVSVGPTLKVILNAAQELEGTGASVTNNTPATAENLSSAFTPLTTDTGSPDRAGVAGLFTGSPDHYAIPLQAGQSLSAALGQSAANDRLFNPPTVIGMSPVVGSAPTDVAVGDLDGNGVPDLVQVLSNTGSSQGTVLVKYGTGSGTYTQGPGISSGAATPKAIRLGDLDGDGKLDAVVANEGGNSVAVLFGTGDASSFTTATLYSGGALPRDLALGDLNGDGRLDIVVGNGSGNVVNILLNNGNGTFGPTTAVSLGGLTFITNGVAIGDVTGDGKADIVAVTVDNPSIAVLVGNGTGAFSGPAVVDPSGGSSPRDLVLGDFNGDGRLDAVVGHGNGLVALFLNQNNPADPFGPFTGLPLGPTNPSVNKLVVADFNGDGHLDVAATFAITSGPFSRVWTGNGAGGFSARLDMPLSGPVGTPAATLADGLAAVDANGDGTPDLVTANTGSNNLSVLLNGLSRLRIDLVDATGTVLAAGVPGVNAVSSITNFVAPAGGTYYLRVSGEGRSEYAAVLTRGTAFETERNDTAVTAQSLDGTSGVLGHVSAAQRLFAAVPGTPGQIQELTPMGSVVRTFPAPNAIAFSATDGVGLAFDGRSLFFLRYSGAPFTLYELDPDTGAVRDSDSITVGSNGVDSLAALNGKVYLGDMAGNQIIVFDPVADAVTQILPYGANNPTIPDLFGGLAGITGPNRLVGTVHTAQGIRVVEIDPATGAATSSFPLTPAAPNGAIRGLAVVEGQIYLNRLDGATRIDIYSRNGTSLGSFANPALASLGGDDNTLSTTDWYFLTVAPGQVINLGTHTPADAFDPRIELFDSLGNLLATGTPGTDGRNETIDHTASGGVYRVRVTGQTNSSGAYFLATAYSLAPQAGDDLATTNEDTAVTVYVLANDIDVDGDTLVIVAVSAPSHGTATLNADGSITYTPNANYHGNDAFTYTVSDGRGGFDTAMVEVFVDTVNDAPVAVDDEYTTDEDITLDVPAPGVLLNDSDVDGDPIVWVEYVDYPAHGELGLSLDGRVVYLPDANYHGPDQFTYFIRDIHGASSGLATVRITVTSVNDPPFAGELSMTGREDQPETINLRELISDADGDPLTVTAVTQPSHGSVVWHSDDTVTYTPNANYFGLDSFTYSIADGNGGTDTATITIDLFPINDTPNALPDAYSTNEDTTLSVAAPGVLGNDTDVEGDPLTAVLLFGPLHGDLVLDGNGSFVYTPDPNYSGPDEFRYSARDGINSGTGPIVVTLTVVPVNDSPTAGPDSYATNEDTVLTVAAPGVLGNDADIDGGPLSVVLAMAPANGSVALAADGAFTYTPNANYHGTDTFTYTVSDGNGGSATGTVTVGVAPVNDAPVAGNDTATTNEDTAVTVVVLSNDTDVDGDSLTVTGATPPAHGTAAINANGTITYTPAANYHGSDSFSYTISDGNGGTATATVSLTVQPVNDAPTLAPATFTLPENSPNATAVGTVTGNDDDGDALGYSIVSGNTGGAFAINATTGQVTVANSAVLDFETTPVFTLTVRVSDPGGLTATATVTIHITDVPPVATIDVLPGNSANQISLKRNSFEVAILSSPEFDARNVDLNSIRFGRTGSEDSVSRHPKRGVEYRLADVNGDGRLDVVVTITTSKTGLRIGDLRAVLTCRLIGNPTLFMAEDAVTVVR